MALNKLEGKIKVGEEEKEYEIMVDLPGEGLLSEAEALIAAAKEANGHIRRMMKAEMSPEQITAKMKGWEPGKAMPKAFNKGKALANRLLGGLKKGTQTKEDLLAAMKALEKELGETEEPETEGEGEGELY